MGTKQSGIYLITNTVNGKCYVGSTNDRRVRWGYHRWNLRKNKHPNPHLQAAWNMYSEAAFEFMWLYDAPVEQLLSEEQKWLEANPDGYNIARDAQSFAKGLRWPEERKRLASIACTGRKHSPETKQKISEYWKGRNRKPRSSEHCRKLSKAMMGKRNGLGHHPSPEARKKMSEANLGNKHCLGKSPSTETRQKISEANKGRKRTPETRRLISEVQRGRRASPETRARMSLAHKLYNQRQREQTIQQATA